MKPLIISFFILFSFNVFAQKQEQSSTAKQTTNNNSSGWNNNTNQSSSNGKQTNQLGGNNSNNSGSWNNNQNSSDGKQTNQSGAWGNNNSNNSGSWNNNQNSSDGKQTNQSGAWGNNNNNNSGSWNNSQNSSDGKQTNQSGAWGNNNSNNSGVNTNQESNVGNSNIDEEEPPLYGVENNYSDSKQSNGNNSRNSNNTILHHRFRRNPFSNRRCVLQWSCLGAILKTSKTGVAITEQDFAQRLGNTYAYSFSQNMNLGQSSLQTMSNIAGFNYTFINSFSDPSTFNQLIRVAQNNSNPIVLLTLSSFGGSQVGLLIYGIVGSGAANNTVFSAYINGNRGGGLFADLVSAIGNQPVILIY